MRYLTAILATGGIFWALYGLLGWLAIASGLPTIRTFSQVVETVGWICFLSAGYFIWWSWVVHAFTGSFPTLQPRVFWFLSLVHHLLAVIFMLPPSLGASTVIEWFMQLWCPANILIALVMGRRVRSDDSANKAVDRSKRS